MFSFWLTVDILWLKSVVTSSFRNTTHHFRCFHISKLIFVNPFFIFSIEITHVCVKSNVLIVSPQNVKQDFKIRNFPIELRDRNMKWIAYWIQFSEFSLPFHFIRILRVVLKWHMKQLMRNFQLTQVKHNQTIEFKDSSVEEIKARKREEANKKKYQSTELRINCCIASKTWAITSIIVDMMMISFS